MEIRLTLAQMRSRVLARSGTSTDALVFAQSKEQLDEFIRSAVLHLMSIYDWPSATQESVTVRWPGDSAPGVGTDQRYLTYPADASAGCILDIAVWDADSKRYLPLTRAAIPLSVHTDPLDTEGGTNDEQTRGTPRIFREGRQIEIWPLADKEYDLKIIYQPNGELADDDSLSPVDSELTILLALADWLESQGEMNLASVQRSKFQARYVRLRHHMHAWTTIKLGRDRSDGVGTPNYDTSPSVL